MPTRSFLGEKIKKELNKIRPFVPPPKRSGLRGVRFSDIVSFLVDYYKKRERIK